MRSLWKEGVNVDLLVLRPVQRIVIQHDNEKQKSNILKIIEENDFGVQKMNNLLIKAYENEWVQYLSRSRVFSKNDEDCVKEVTNYLQKLDRLDLLEGFFEGEWDIEE